MENQMTTINADQFADINQLGEAIKQELRKGIVTITFRKKDGTVRVLKGTTNETLLPKVEPLKPDEVNPVRKQSDAVVVCFDTEKQEWRSFRKDSVIEYQHD